MVWIQREIHFPPHRAGFYLITQDIEREFPEIRDLRVGLFNIFLQHTSASLTINENADPDVPIDLHRALDSLAPEDFPYAHTLEGRDDMPAHIKSSLQGCSLTIPIGNGRLRLGTWQGIYLCEHRRRGSGRTIICTLQGE